MSNIPLARQLLVDVRQALLDREETGLADMISEAIDLMHRRRAVRRMRAKSPSITADLRQQIIHLASTTEMHAAEIAVELGVNPGRVSEVLQRYARIN